MGLAIFDLSGKLNLVGDDPAEKSRVFAVEPLAVPLVLDGSPVPEPERSIEIELSNELFDQITRASEGGDQVLLASDGQLVGGPHKGAYGGSFAIDLTSGTFIAPDWYEGATDPVLSFIQQQVAVPTAPDKFLNVILEWNKESNDVMHGQEAGAILEAYAEFLKQTYGIGVAYPTLSPDEYWAAAPHACRTYLDAPPGVLKALQTVPITIEIPKSGYPSDAGLCLRAESGGMGCAELGAFGGGVVRLDAYDTGEPVLVRLQKLGGAWGEWVTLATLEPSELKDAGAGGITLDLVDSLTAASYEEVTKAVASA